MYRLTSEQQQVGIERGGVGGRACRPLCRRDRQERRISTAGHHGSRWARAARSHRSGGVRRPGSGDAYGGCACSMSSRGAVRRPRMVYLMHLCGVACYTAGAREDRALPARRRSRHAPQHPRVQRARLAQPFLGAGQPGGLRRRRGVISAHRNRSSRRPDRLMVMSCRRSTPTRSNPSRARSISSFVKTRASRCRGRGMGSACVAMPARP